MIKINAKMLIALLYVKNKCDELENTVSFKTANKMKYLAIYLSRHVQDLPAENYKILIKGIKLYLDRWKYI